MPVHAADPPWFDFRSPQFQRDAQALARATGRSLALCRQELFIAEGCVDEARAVLDSLTPQGERPATRH